MKQIINSSLINSSDIMFNLSKYAESFNSLKGNMNETIAIGGSFVDRNETFEEFDLAVTDNTSNQAIVLCSCLFFLIGLIGICGNLLVIVSVLCSKKMRTSMTNLLITNLAVADLIIMVFGVPEIVQFMRNTGWTLNVITCKINRYVLVSALYGSILTLLALSVER